MPDQFTLKTRDESVSELETTAPVATADAPTNEPVTAEPAVDTEIQASSVSEPDSVSDETAGTGQLTAVPTADVTAETAAAPPPAPVDFDTNASVGGAQNVRGGSASSDVDVGSGSMSLLLLLAMVARFGFGAFARLASRLCKVAVTHSKLH